jgi:single-stranded DNA-binding protein
VDINLAVLGGRLAAPAEHRTFESGAAYLRLLVTVRSREPRARVDVIPVTLWDPPAELVADSHQPGRRIWVAGAVQRRFWTGDEVRRSRLELVARHVELRPVGDDADAMDVGGQAD